MKVGDIMTKNVLTVESSDPIDHVVGVMIESKVHGVPVVEGKKLVGMVTETDFFSKDSAKFNLADYMRLVGKNKAGVRATKEEKERIQKLITITVGDIMSTDRKTVFAEDQIEKLLEIFRETGFSRIPVVDFEGNLVGIITRSDIIRTMRI